MLPQEPPEDFKADFMALCKDETKLPAELTRLELWIILSQLQLALRHPGNHGPSSAHAHLLA